MTSPNIPAPEGTVPSYLAEADRIINGRGRGDYGGALESFSRIGRLWSEVLGQPVSAEEVALCLIQLKVARAINDSSQQRPIKRDSAVDIAGYAGLLEYIERDRAAGQLSAQFTAEGTA